MMLSWSLEMSYIKNKENFVPWPIFWLVLCIWNHHRRPWWQSSYRLLPPKMVDGWLSCSSGEEFDYNPLWLFLLVQPFFFHWYGLYLYGRAPTFRRCGCMELTNVNHSIRQKSPSVLFILIFLLQAQREWLNHRTILIANYPSCL